MSRDNRLLTLLVTLATCLHTVKLHIYMLWLTMILQKPAIARRTIAIELLRRSDQIKSHRRHAPSTTATQFGFAHSIQRGPPAKQNWSHAKSHWMAESTARGRSLLHEQVAIKVPSTSLLAASQNIDSSLRPSGFGSYDTPGVSASLKLSWSESAPWSIPRDVLTPAFSEGVQDSDTPGRQGKRQRRLTSLDTSPQLASPISPFLESARPSYARGGSAHERLSRPARHQHLLRRERVSMSDSYYTLPLSDIDSAGSDATHAKTKHSPCPQIRTQTDATDGAQDEGLGSPNDTLVNSTDLLEGPITNKRWSNYSMDSTSTTIRKPSTATLRARSRLNGGLLELKSNTAGPKTPLPTRRHRRMLSLNLPIRPSFSQPSNTQRSQTPGFASTTPTPRATDDDANAPAQIESELQYKQRHIFVGTASLHRFLDILETCSPDSTTKPAVMKAFTALAHKEQIMVRRSSLSPADWNLVARVAADVADFDYIVLARVQLGSVSLQQFLDSVPFNGREEAPLVAVVEAFKIASHMDAEEARNVGSKARAYRSLLASLGQAAE